METHEVELKFARIDADDLRRRLIAVGAQPLEDEEHADTYFAHPCRSFAETGEALRIRRIDGVAHVTYKGTKQPGPTKTRLEMEWGLGEEDRDGRKTTALWQALGFKEVMTVRKLRKSFAWGAIVVTVDQVEGLGEFAEVERVVEHGEVEQARREVIEAASTLGLTEEEQRSYLRMLLER